MKRHAIRLLPLASAIAVGLLVVGLAGFAILFEMEEGVRNPALARTTAGSVRVGVFQALTFPLALLVWGLAERSAADGDGLDLLGFLGVVVDAWLYGYAMAALIGLARRQIVHRVG